jgi:hypothetical protein
MSYYSSVNGGEPVPSAPGPNSVRSTWMIPLREGGPDVLFIVDSSRKLTLEEMVERTRAARKLEDQQRAAVKGGVRHETS